MPPIKKEISQIYVDWIKSLKFKEDAFEFNDFSKNAKIESITSSNTFLDWIGDPDYFTKSFSAICHKIIDNKAEQDNFYVSYEYSGNAKFRNENDYPDMEEPVKEYRLLALFRYWNMVEYFYPYKYLTGEKWQNVLDRLIPVFMDNKTPYTYAVLEMIATIHDTHATIKPPKKTVDKYGFLPFDGKIFGDKILITKLANDSLCKINNVEVGDVITAINDTAIGQLISVNRKYISASNEAVFYREAFGFLQISKEEHTKLTINRNGKSLEIVCRRYPLKYINISLEIPSKPSFKMLGDNVGYIDVGSINYQAVFQSYQLLKNTKAVIFDVRSYPHNVYDELCKYYGQEEKEFVKFTKPNPLYPGAFSFAGSYSCGPETFFAYGYKGKIIVLINEQTQSHAEFSCMAFKTFPNVTFIGSQTTGANGNVSAITLPGGYETLFSGIGVYYPDCTVTQRIGIVPDINVEPTLEGMRSGVDEVLEKAIEYAKKSERRLRIL